RRGARRAKRITQTEPVWVTKSLDKALKLSDLGCLVAVARPAAFEHVGFERRLRRLAACMPSLRAAVIGEAAWFGRAVAVVVGETVAEGRGADVRFPAMLGVFQLGFQLHVDD